MVTTSGALSGEHLDPKNRLWEYDGDGTRIFKEDIGLPVRTEFKDVKKVSCGPDYISVYLGEVEDAKIWHVVLKRENMEDGQYNLIVNLIRAASEQAGLEIKEKLIKLLT